MMMMMIMTRRYEVYSVGTKTSNDIDSFYQIERLQSQDLLESDGAEESQRSSQRLPPLNEEECSVFSQGKLSTQTFFLARAEKRSHWSDLIKTLWRNGKRD